VLDIDSPGGSIAGITELAAEIRSARGAKPIVAVANTLAASAAYWLGSQADQFVVTPSGHVGSIGVYAVHQDVSKMLDEAGVKMTIVSAGPHKTEGNEFEPLTDEARAEIQARVDASYDQFVEDVAAGRNVPVATVRADFGGGRVLTARDALKAGMVDRVETLAQTIQRVGRSASSARRMSAEGILPDEGAEPFTERVAAFATEAEQIAEHAAERARLRAKEGRPAFSDATEQALRSIRGSLDHLLAPVDPASPAAPVDPVPSASTPPPAAPPRFRSREDWLRHLENR
jgi:signal peptide peptidase SppA